MAVGLLSLTATPPQPRLLFVLYGQSNMNGFVGVGSSPPAALPGTQFYNGSIITTVPAANGIREFLNAVAPTRTRLALNGSVDGTDTPGLIKGSSGYTALLAQINAVILPTDQVMILWDQGEGDAGQSPHPVENGYKSIINQLHTDIVTDIGRTKATCPFIMASLGSTSVGSGTVTGGTTQESWQTIKNAIRNCALEQPHNLFSHSNMDLQRTDGYHYDGASQGKQGKRFAQCVNTRLGLASGEAHWEISTGAVVDGTHTNINVVHGLGTDFTPTSGGNGWEVTGDNGATWIAATSARNSATQLQLTHSSISTTSARKVRYQWGGLPPDASGNNPTTAPILDNSALQVPLNFTTWDISPTPLSVIPVPTWRYGVALTGSGQVQTTTMLPLGPSIGAQKFVVLSLAGVGSTGAVTLTPKDAFGVAVGTPVVASLVKKQGSVQIHQATLGADANSAYAVDVSVDYGGNPFGGSFIQLETVPLADLSSTTATGTGGATATGNIAATATVNVSAGGFVFQVARTTANYTTAAVLTGTETFVKRGENPSGIATYSADASNCAANASSSVTGTFQNSGNIDLALASWR